MRTILKNGCIITPVRIIENAGIVINSGRIEALFDSDNFEQNKDDQVIDVHGQYISPGFIDIHTHGGGGYDFMDGTVDAIVQGAKAHLAFGTTSIVPTTLTSTLDELFRTLDHFQVAKDTMKEGPNLLGLHLEGPYFSMEQKGAQDPKYIKNPDKDEYLKILDYSNNIIRWSIAPELEGSLEMARELSRRNILCSIAHSNANYDEVLAGYENGFTHITHLYSGMSTVHRKNAFRHAGVVESAYLINDMTVEIIADGVHLPESLLKLIYKIKGADTICLVTDSMRAAGMPEGEYVLGSQSNGMKVIVEDGVAKLMDKSAFAGSTATADRLLKVMTKLAEVPLLEAVKMLTITPAKVIGVDKSKGSIVAEKDADIVVFDKDINISMVFVDGSLRIQN